jgi:hypothetical protein
MHFKFYKKYAYSKRSFPFNEPYRFVTEGAIVTLSFFSQTVRSAYRVINFDRSLLVFDLEPYRTKRGTIIRVLLRFANHTAPIMGAITPKLVRYGSQT